MNMFSKVRMQLVQIFTWLFFCFLSVVNAQAVTPCDTLAAHPADPQGLADGVPDGDIDTGAAIPACEAALSEDPDNARLQFQLGRAYWEADRDDEAVEMFQTAAVGGDYAAAYAYLGIAYEYGYVTGSPETELARALYRVALDRDFEPANDLLAAVPEDRPMTPAEGTELVSFEGYYQPDILQNIYDEDFGALNESSLKVAVYLKGMYEFFKQEVNWFDLRCAHMHDTRLTQKVIRNLLGAGASTGNAVANAEGVVGRILQNFSSQMQQGDIAGMLGSLLEVGILTDEGKRDAGHLVSDAQDRGETCDSATIKRLYKNAQYYFLREMTFRQ